MRYAERENKRSSPTLQRLGICYGFCANIGVIIGLCLSVIYILRNHFIQFGLYTSSLENTRTFINNAILISSCIGLLCFFLSRFFIWKEWSLSRLVIVAIDIILITEIFYLLAVLFHLNIQEYAIPSIIIALFMVLISLRSQREIILFRHIRDYLICANLEIFVIWACVSMILGRSNSYMLHQVLSYLPASIDSIHVLHFILSINLISAIVLAVLSYLFKKGSTVSLIIYGAINALLPLAAIRRFEKMLIVIHPERITKNTGILGLWQAEFNKSGLLISTTAFLIVSLTMGYFAYVWLRQGLFKRLITILDGERTSRIIMRFLPVTLMLVVAINAAYFIASISLPIDGNRPNIILISIDTLRADHIGCYGYKRKTTPNIDRLAEDGVVFKNMIAQENATAPSHASILTSLYPIKHGLRRNGGTLNSSLLTLAEYLKDYGYTTAAFVSQFILEGKYGFSQGFQHYDDSSKSKPMGAMGKDTTRLALSWLKNNYRNRFFLFIHYFDPHLDYAAPEPYNAMFDPNYEGRFAKRFPHNYGNIVKKSGRPITDREAKHAIALYDGEIRYVDKQVGRIMSFINEHELRDNTLIVITADHGEGMYEHGYFDHGGWLYNGELLVPCIVSCPGLLPKGVEINNIVECTTLELR